MFLGVSPWLPAHCASPFPLPSLGTTPSSCTSVPSSNPVSYLWQSTTAIRTSCIVAPSGRHGQPRVGGASRVRRSTSRRWRLTRNWRMRGKKNGGGQGGAAGSTRGTASLPTGRSDTGAAMGRSTQMEVLHPRRHHCSAATRGSECM